MFAINTFRVLNENIEKEWVNSFMTEVSIT